MPDIEIKRGYEVLPDNNIRFGIRVINNRGSVISDVEVILDYSEDSFKLQGDKIQKLGTIPPSVPRTAKFILQPKGCIHKDELGATVLYKDHEWNRQMVTMRSKEIHCVCPFLKEKSMSRAEFLTLSKSGSSSESGVNFENIGAGRVVELLSHTCKNRLYKVDEFPVDGGSILYLAGDAVGEKAYYLLTAVVKEHEGLTQVFLRGNSEKDHGLTGFLNETLDNLRHLVVSGKVREIGIIRKEQVINIIDSVVQRTTFGGGEGASSINIRDSVVQRTEFNAVDEGKEEERRRKEQKEREKKAATQCEQRWESSKHVVTLKTTVPKKISKEIQTNGFLGFGKKNKVVDVFEATEEEIQVEVRDNSIGMKFTHIPAGEFMMGSNEYDFEKPVHKVTIKKPFYLGTYPVTQKEWKAVMGDNPSRFKGDNLPVEQVSWNDVQEFIKKLNQKEGGNKYRLPSEAEWEYACRARTTTEYSFGDDESKLGEYAWYETNSGSKTHDVGQKKPNPWGLYDMHGNVWEWVQDKWHDNYNGAPTDGSSWVSGGGSSRVFRGGSWGYDARSCRPADRFSGGPGGRFYSVGFRLLQEP